MMVCALAKKPGMRTALAIVRMMQDIMPKWLQHKSHASQDQLHRVPTEDCLVCSLVQLCVDPYMADNRCVSCCLLMLALMLRSHAQAVVCVKNRACCHVLE